MKIMRFLSLFVALLALQQPVLMAQEQGLFAVSKLWQSHHINPAFAARTERFTIGIASAGFALNSPDVQIGSWVQNRQLLLDSNKTRNLSADNRFMGTVQLSSLDMALPYKNWVFSLGFAQNISAETNIHGNFIHLLAAGNAGFLGKNSPFGTTINASTYAATTVGVAYKHGDNWDFGAKIKYLAGMKGFFTEKNKLDMAFSATDYAITFDTDLMYHGFGVAAVSDLAQGIKPRLVSPNIGLALDFGARYQTEKWSVSASALNVLGQISWKNEGTTYASKGVFTYRGQNADDFNTLFTADSLSQSRVQDTLKAVVHLQETPDARYTQKLPLQLTIGGTYRVSESVELGALWRLQTTQTATQMAFSVSGTYSLSDDWQVGAQYAFIGNRLDNLGLFGHYRYKSVQVYALTDNILGVFQPYNSGFANARLGFNLSF